MCWTCDNYGVEDYWAIPREFLCNGGDCEDYAITKLFSLRWLGLPAEDLRLVIVQDTNLRVPHAVLAVSRGADIFILDSQVQAVLSHRDVVHYAPVFSINEAQLVDPPAATAAGTPDERRDHTRRSVTAAIAGAAGAGRRRRPCSSTSI